MTDRPPGGMLLDGAAGDRGASGRRVGRRAWRRSSIRSRTSSGSTGPPSPAYYDHNLLTVVESAPRQPWIDERLWKVRARRVVLATGAAERPLVFADNDRPGVMPASAALACVCRYAVRPGARAVAVTNNNSTYRTVLELVGGGDRGAGARRRPRPASRDAGRRARRTRGSRCCAAMRSSASPGFAP